MEWSCMVIAAQEIASEAKMYHRDKVWSLKFQLKNFISWIGRRQRKMFPLTKRIDKIIVFFSFLYSLPISLLTPNLINCIVQILKDYFPPRLKLLTVSPGHRCSCIWIQFSWFLFCRRNQPWYQRRGHWRRRRCRRGPRRWRERSPRRWGRWRDRQRGTPLMTG